MQPDLPSKNQGIRLDVIARNVRVIKMQDSNYYKLITRVTTNLVVMRSSWCDAALHLLFNYTFFQKWDKNKKLSDGICTLRSSALNGQALNSVKPDLLRPEQCRPECETRMPSVEIFKLLFFFQVPDEFLFYYFFGSPNGTLHCLVVPSSLVTSQEFLLPLTPL